MKTVLALATGLILACFVLAALTVFVFDPFGTVPNGCWEWLE